MGQQQRKGTKNRQARSHGKRRGQPRIATLSSAARTQEPGQLLWDLFAKYRNDPGTLLSRPPSPSGGTQDTTKSKAAEVVEQLHQSLGWSQRQLSAWSGIAQPQLSRWLSGKDYALGRDEIARLAWALAGALDRILPFELDMDALKKNLASWWAAAQQREPQQVAADLAEKLYQGFYPRLPSSRSGRSKLDFLLHLLLTLSGYSCGSRFEDIIWREKFEQRDRDPNARLTIGWFPWEPLTGGTKESGFTGFAREVCDAVCRLIGHGDWEPHRINFQSTANVLCTREVDLIAPLLLRIPWRYAKYGLSDPIPGISVGVCAVCPSEHSEKVCNGEDLNEDAIELVLPPGEVGSSLAAAAYSRAERATEKLYEGLESSSLELTGHAQDLLERVKQEPLGKGGRVRVVVTNRPTGAWAVTKLEQGKWKLIRPRRLEYFEFPVSFGLHLDEPQLRSVVNLAIDVLQKSGFFQRLIEEHDLANKGFTVTESRPSGSAKDASSNSLGGGVIACVG